MSIQSQQQLVAVVERMQAIAQACGQLTTTVESLRQLIADVEARLGALEKKVFELEGPVNVRRLTLKDVKTHGTND